MDPNATLAKIREALIAYGDAATPEESSDAADALAMAVADLDNWITCGGFLPSDWSTRNRA